MSFTVGNAHFLIIIILMCRILAEGLAETKTTVAHSRRASMTAHISANIIDKLGQGHLRQSEALHKFLSPSHNQRVRLVKQLRRAKRQEKERGNGLMSGIIAHQPSMPSTPSSISFGSVSMMSPSVSGASSTVTSTMHQRNGSNGPPVRQRRGTNAGLLVPPPPFPPYPFTLAGDSLAPKGNIMSDDAKRCADQQASLPPSAASSTSQSDNGTDLSSDMPHQKPQQRLTTFMETKSNEDDSDSDHEAAERRAAQRAAYRTSMGISASGVRRPSNTPSIGSLASPPIGGLGIRERLTSIEEQQVSQSQQLTELVSAVRLMYQQMGIMYMNLHQIAAAVGSGSAATSVPSTVPVPSSSLDGSVVPPRQLSERRPSASGMMLSTAPRLAIRAGKSCAVVPRTVTAHSMSSSLQPSSSPVFSPEAELAAVEDMERFNDGNDTPSPLTAPLPLPLSSMGMPALPPLRTLTTSIRPFPSPSRDVDVPESSSNYNSGGVLTNGSRDNILDSLVPVPNLSARRRSAGGASSSSSGSSSSDQRAAAIAQSRQQAALVMAQARALINNSMAAAAASVTTEPQPFSASSFPGLGLPPFEITNSNDDSPAKMSHVIPPIMHHFRANNTNNNDNDDDSDDRRVSFALPTVHGGGSVVADAPHFHIEP
jgi:hypothetical protein